MHNTYTGKNEPSKRNYVTIYHFELENVILETHFFTQQQLKIISLKNQLFLTLPQTKAYYTLHAFSCFRVFTSFFYCLSWFQNDAKTRKPIFSSIKNDAKTRVVCNGPKRCWKNNRLIFSVIRNLCGILTLCKIYLIFVFNFFHHQNLLFIILW